MQCNEARTLLIDYAEDHLADAARATIGDHLDTCAQCLADYDVIVDLQLQAEVWHDVTPPRWQAPRVTPQISLSGMQQWFPTLASALALIVAVGIYLQMPAGNTITATPPLLSSQARAALSETPVAYREPALDLRFTNNRQERQQELQALVQLLRADMDRRNEETEDSLRYVIAHQIQGQREIDDLYKYIKKINFPVPPPGEQM